MKTSRLVMLLVLGSLFFTSRANAADITWFSLISDPAGADAGFVDVLEAAGHNVIRHVEIAPLTAADIAALNAADLVIASRSVNSSAFDNLNGQIWNTQITSPVIYMSAYVTRNNRLGMQTGNDVPDSGPTPLVATNPNHPIFDGISFQADGVTMANDYNVMIDRGDSTIANPLVPGANVIATNPTIAGGDGIAIAHWPAGITVTDEQVGAQVLAGHRFFFAGGSRELGGAGMGVDTAGKYDLTADGERLFLNTVNFAIAIPEPSTWLLAVLGLSLLLVARKRLAARNC